MEEIIRDFPKQLLYEPEVVNAASLKKAERIIVVGMGGSHLAADILKAWRPELDLTIHSNYGLKQEMHKTPFYKHGHLHRCFNILVQLVLYSYLKAYNSVYFRHLLDE